MDLEKEELDVASNKVCISESNFAQTTDGCIRMNFTCNFQIKTCSFYNCTVANQRGSAVYLRSDQCESHISKVCGVSCLVYGNQYGQFAYISVSQEKTNDIKDSCIASCGSEDAYAETIGLWHGTVSTKQVNFTRNICGAEPVIYSLSDRDYQIGNSLSMQYCMMHKNSWLHSYAS